MEKQVIFENEHLKMLLIDGKVIIVSNKINKTKKEKRYKFFNYYPNKKYVLGLEGLEETYESEMISFDVEDETNLENCKTVFDILSSSFKENEYQYISDCLNFIEKHFRIFFTLLNEEKLQGLFAEFYFMYYVKEKGFDLDSYFRKENSSTFDLYFQTTSKFGEIKSCLNDSNNFVISHKQLSYDYDNTFFIGISLFKDENGINILQLLNLINSNDPEFSEQLSIYKKLFEDDIIAQEIKYGLKNSKVKIYKGSDLPRIEIVGDDKSKIKNIKYLLDTSGVSTISLENFVNEVF